MRILIILLFICNTPVFGYKERIFNELVRLGVDTLSAKVFTAQAHLESGGFTNPLTKKHNNVFSILHDKSRKLTTSLGPYAKAEGRAGYASYASIEAAVQDFLYFLDYWGISRLQHSTGLYASRLKKLKSPKSGKIRQYYTSPLSEYKTSLYKRFKVLWS